MAKTMSIIGADIGKVWLQIEKGKDGCLIKVGIDGLEDLNNLIDYVRDEHGVDIGLYQMIDEAYGYAEETTDNPKSFSAIRKWISENTNWFRG